MLEFADRRNGFSRSDSVVFDVGSTGFWTVDFFQPQLRGWLQGVVFANRRNGVRVSHSALFDVDSTDFWTIDFFHPQFWGWLQGVVFTDRRNGFRQSHSALFDVDSTGFWSTVFFNPQLWGWLQGLVGVLHPSYYDHKSSIGGYYKCRWVWYKSAIYTLQRSLVGTSSVPSCREENPGYRHTAFFVFGHRSAPQQPQHAA